tara:strand:+ start:1052 stop:1273 length:222 start_codon:yes stop_codon:yes gene_type:complete
VPLLSSYIFKPIKHKISFVWGNAWHLFPGGYRLVEKALLSLEITEVKVGGYRSLIEIYSCFEVGNGLKRRGLA